MSLDSRRRLYVYAFPFEFAQSSRALGYEEAMTRGHWCPPRLCGRNDSLVEAVNDWHFAMLFLGACVLFIGAQGTTRTAMSSTGMRWRAA